MGIEPGVMLYQLSYQAPREQGGGKEGIFLLIINCLNQCSHSYILFNSCWLATDQVNSSGVIYTAGMHFSSLGKTLDKSCA